MLKLLARCFVVVFLSFLLFLGISLYRGTREFNYYCDVAQRVNPERIYFRGDIDELGGFSGCRLNTLTLDGLFMLFGLGVAAFLGQTYLIFKLKRRAGKVNLAGVAFNSIILLCLFLLTGVFQQVHHGFLEGGTWVSKNSTYYIGPLFFYGWVLFAMVIAQGGPIILTYFSSWRNSKQKGIKLFLMSVLQSILLEIFVLFTLFFFVFYIYLPILNYNSPRVKPQPILMPVDTPVKHLQINFR